jgi:hypothetical protein
VDCDLAEIEENVVTRLIVNTDQLLFPGPGIHLSRECLTENVNESGAAFKTLIF